MKLRITAVCDVGSVRNNNEDMVLVGKKIIRDERFQGAIELNDQQPVFILAVADGMGGANAGEVASQMVIEGIRENIYLLPTGMDVNSLKASIQLACQEIHQSVITAGRQDVSKAGMGSTLVALFWYEGQLYYLHTGDSRLYRFRDKTLMQITEDHSLMQLNRNNEIPSNIIYNSFGGGASFFVAIELAGKKVLDGDLFLLCSDGVTDMLSDEEMESVLAKEGFEDALLEKAKAKGGVDNISYILAEVSEVKEA